MSIFPKTMNGVHLTLWYVGAAFFVAGSAWNVFATWEPLPPGLIITLFGAAFFGCALAVHAVRLHIEPGYEGLEIGGVKPRTPKPPPERDGGQDTE